MYNNGNSSKNVTGASVVDGTMESADYPDNGLSGDKIDGGIISNFQSTGIDDRLATGKAIYTNGTKVGIGTSTPSKALSVVGDISVPNANNYYLLTTAGSGAGWLGSDSAHRLLLTNKYQDIRITTEGAHNTAFYTNNIERMRVQSTGGISFNGDTAAANALDDYEEGTWTPNWVGATGTSTGTYTKIGNVVHYTAQIVVDGALTGGVTISGHPFGIGLGHNTSVILRDIGANIYAGTTSESGITIYFISPSTGGVSTLSATVPFTWVSGDKIFVSTTHRV